MKTTFITLPKPIAKLTHEATHSVISVYKPIPKYQQWFLRVCFGLKYENV